MTEEFTCPICRMTYKKSRSDAEENAEAVETFGEGVFEEEEVCIVCHTCYVKYQLKPVGDNDGN